MKIRTDFVTNSSSSSFVLVFDNEESVNCFLDRCSFFEYPQLAEMIKKMWVSVIEITNTSSEAIDIRGVIDEIFAKAKSLPFLSRMKLESIKSKTPVLEKYKTISCPLMSLGEPYPEGFELEDFKYGSANVRVRDFKELKNKDEAKKLVYHVMTSDFAYKIANSKVVREKDEPILDYYKRREEYMNSDEFKEIMDEYVKTTDITEQLNRIDKAYAVLIGETWDTSGGLLEWAIRKGFLLDEFSDFCVVSHNVG